MALDPRGTTDIPTLGPPRNTGSTQADAQMQVRWLADFYDLFTRVLNIPGAIQTLSDAGLLQPIPNTGIANDGTAIMLKVNKNGAVSIVPITLGAADSGGAGFRALRVPN